MVNNAQVIKRRAMEIEEEELPILIRIIERPVPNRPEDEGIESSKGKTPVN